MPGIGKAPILPSRSGLASMIEPGVQDPLTIIAASPWANASRSAASSQVEAAGVDRSCSSARSV